MNFPPRIDRNCAEEKKKEKHYNTKPEINKNVPIPKVVPKVKYKIVLIVNDLWTISFLKSYE